MEVLWALLFMMAGPALTLGMGGQEPSRSSGRFGIQHRVRQADFFNGIGTSGETTSSEATLAQISSACSASTRLPRIRRTASGDRSIALEIADARWGQPGSLAAGH